MILDEIIKKTEKRVAQLPVSFPEAPVLDRVSLAGAIRNRDGKNAIIAEIKCASPSGGVIRRNVDMAMMAGVLSRGGCIALSVLTDHTRTEFVLIIIPEALALYQTERLKQELDRLGIRTARIVVNNLIPENTCPFCISRREVQQRYLRKIRERYDDVLEVIEVPLFSGELKGRDTLMEYARYLGWKKDLRQREAAEKV